MITDQHHFLDATGLRCPLPVLRAQKFLSAMDSGETLKLLTTDPASKRDIPAFCREAGHELVAFTERKNDFLFEIKAR